MIVAMKKVFVFVLEHKRQEAIEKLAELGVVHIEHAQAPKSEEINILQEELALIDSALSIISDPAFVMKPAPIAEKPVADVKATCRHIIDLRKRLEQLEEFSRTLSQWIAEWEKWGDFSPEEIASLSAQGVHVKLYQIPDKEVGAISDEIVVTCIFKSGGFSHCVCIAHHDFSLGFKEINVPKMSLAKMKSRLAEDARIKEKMRNELCQCNAFHQGLILQRKSIAQRLELSNAVSGMQSDGVISYVSGYIPTDLESNFLQNAALYKWGVLTQDPSDEDSVPTLLRNPRWVELIKPLFKLLGIAPGYRELDVSFLFLGFFSLFFGILIGDAGYGACYALLTLWVHKKKGANQVNANVFFFLYVLSCSAILWGILTGTFFGQSWVSKLGIKPLFASLNNPTFMQSFCFMIGVIHLSLAHSWRALLKFPHLSALSDVGFLFIVWAAYFLSRMLILSAPLPAVTMWLLGGGILLVLFFTNPQKNVLKSLGDGFAATGFGIGLMNNLSDVISYIRLFAVGLAGVSIAETTNAMASNLGGGFAALIAGAVIIVIGHALNIILGPMSVLVHGLRLNVLEFSMHANVTWSGIEYAPLRKSA